MMPRPFGVNVKSRPNVTFARFDAPVTAAPKSPCCRIQRLASRVDFRGEVMIKKLLAVLLAFFAAAAFAAVDVNRADQAALDSVKGIGPAIATKIIDERKKGAFKDWADFIERVKGVGEGNAAKFSAEGLTVNGASFNGAAPAAKKADTPAKADAKADAKVEAKAAAKADDKAATAADEKAAKKAAKEAAKKEKADKKAEAASAAKK
jgi:competence protein ComEA